MNEGGSVAGEMRANMVLQGIRHSQTYGRGKNEYAIEIDGLDLVVWSGETLGILGAKRDGINTVADIMCGSLSPSSGHIYESGQVINLSPSTEFLADESLRVNLQRVARARQVNGASLRGLIDVVVDEAHAGGVIDEIVDDIDSLTVARCQIFMALATGIRLLIIEDAESISEAFRDERVESKLHGFRRRGGSIVLLSRDVNFLARTSDRIAWFRKSEILMDAPARQIPIWYNQLTKAERSKEKAKAGQILRRIRAQFGPAAIRVVK